MFLQKISVTLSENVYPSKAKNKATRLTSKDIALAPPQQTYFLKVHDGGNRKRPEI